MKYLQLTLSTTVPVILTLLPISLPFLSLFEIIVNWLRVVFLLSLYSVSFLAICTPQITKPTTRLSTVKAYFKKEIILISATNLLFCYFSSNLFNIWGNDVLHVNLSLFWTIVTGQYFLFDCLVNYKYKYNTSVIKVHYSVLPSFKDNLKEVAKVLRYAGPVYVLLYKDITTFTSTVCGSPSEELSFYFLLRPATGLSIAVSSLVTFTLLNISYQATLHTAIRSTVTLVRGSVSVEKCAESLSKEDVRVRYSAVTDLLRECRNSLTARQTALSLQDGHPVIWHLIYKEWVKGLYLFNKSVSEKSAVSSVTDTTKTDSTKPVGRALVEEKPTKLYSLTQPVSPIKESVTKQAAASKLSKMLSDVLNDALQNFKKSSREQIIGSRLGKYLLTEQVEVVSENKLKDVGFLVHGSSLVETLCCVAPQEDRYGVVQLVLPEILDTVSATLKAIDQMPIANSSTAQLKRALNLFLHHVINTYQNNIFNLTLSTDTCNLLQQLCV